MRRALFAFNCNLYLLIKQSARNAAVMKANLESRFSPYQASAMHSISQSAPLGRSFTATQLLAGLEVKYFASGIKENNAGMIDAALADMKYAMKASLMSEVQSETKRTLEYEIEF